MPTVNPVGLDVRLLGSPQVHLDGLPISGFISHKAQALFYYLVVTQQPHTRLKLASLFWPEADEPTGLKNLRDILHNLRKLFAPFLNISRQAVSFHTRQPYALDVEQLIDLLERSNTGPFLPEWVNTIDLDRWEFLEGFHIDEAPEFEDWVLWQREHLRASYLQILHTLADHYLIRRDYQPGLSITARLLTVDPWSETIYRQRMKLFAYDGQRSAALQAYEQCRSILAETFGVEPTPETAALHQRIQAGPSEEATDFPPLHNLPRSLTPFLGRQAELNEIRPKISDSRYPLVTLTGEGGIGKTRLALALAQQVLYEFADGVWFVSLASIDLPETEKKHDGETPSQMSDRIADRIAESIARAMRLPLQEKTPYTKQLFQGLQDRELLIILDNFEHLMDGADFLLALVKRIPKLHLIVTSRQRLNFQMEYVFRLSGLPVPVAAEDEASLDFLRPDERPSAVPIASYDSVRLFVERADRTSPGFVLDAVDVQPVAEICRSVEGLPLAIELAAALVEQKPLAQIASAIRSGIDALAISLRDLPPRHRSILAVFDYSWSFLSSAQADLLARCAIFQGSFSAAAAAAVAGATPDLLDRLIGRSLLRQDAPDRYSLHELVRQFAAEKLLAEGIQATPITQDKHSRYYLDFVDRWVEPLEKGIDREQVTALAQDRANVRLAWDWAIRQKNIDRIGQSANGIALYYAGLSSLREGVSRMNEGMDLLTGAGDESPSPAQSRALMALQACSALLLEILGNLAESEKMAALAASAAENAQEKGIAAHALATWGFVTVMQKKDVAEANKKLQRALALSQAEGQNAPWVTARILGNLAILSYRMGKPDTAHSYLEQAVVISRTNGIRKMLAISLNNLGVYHKLQGDFLTARQMLDEGLSIQRELQRENAQGLTLSNLADLTAMLGDYAASLGYCREIQRLARRTKSDRLTAAASLQEMTVLVNTGDFLQALAMGETALAQCQKLGDIHRTARILLLQGQAHRGVGNLAEAQAAYEQALVDWRQAEIPAGSLEPMVHLADLAQQRGDRQQARRLMADVLALLEQTHLQDEAIGNPMALLLTCHKVLKALGDSRSAEPLSTAYRLLQERAAKISDTDARRQFLEAVPTHRAAMAAMTG